MNNSDDTLVDGDEQKRKYQKVNIHLCEECRDCFESGDELVCLSDGFANDYVEYDVNNRRFWHRSCFPEAELKEVLSHAE